MLYLGIDLHRKQMTISLRNQAGDVLLRRQVSTRPEKVNEFLEEVHDLGADDGGSYVAIVEVCGFHDWLVKRLQADGACRDVVVVQPMKRSRKKTDRRDANALSELLWVNRERLLRGDRVQGVRRIHLPSEEEQQDRQVTQQRDRLVRKRTQTINQIRKILRRHNLEWERPTKTFQTQKAHRNAGSNAANAASRRMIRILYFTWRLRGAAFVRMDTGSRWAVARLSVI